MTDDELLRSLLLVGDRDATYACAYLQEVGYRLPNDGPKALQWSRERALAGDAAGMFILAFFLRSGIFTSADKVAARQWCENAAASGFPAALLMLAGFLESGWGGADSDAKKAFELTKRAAELGHAPATAALAVMFETGQLVPRDHERALELFQEAAELGDAYSQCQLGYLLLTDQRRSRRDEAIQWLKESAAQNNSYAHRHLANFYADGVHGLPKDGKRAKYHRDRAAESGFT
jgi:uncharacterized protein